MTAQDEYKMPELPERKSEGCGSKKAAPVYKRAAAVAVQKKKVRRAARGQSQRKRQAPPQPAGCAGSSAPKALMH